MKSGFEPFGSKPEVVYEEQLKIFSSNFGEEVSS